MNQALYLGINPSDQTLNLMPKLYPGLFRDRLKQVCTHYGLCDLMVS